MLEVDEPVDEKTLFSAGVEPRPFNDHENQKTFVYPLFGHDDAF